MAQQVLEPSLRVGELAQRRIEGRVASDVGMIDGVRSDLNPVAVHLDDLARGHVSRLAEGLATDLRPGTKLIYELGMDRTGKMAASSIRIAPVE